MPKRPLDSRQYISEAWHPFTIEKGGESVTSNLNYATEVDGNPTLCVIPTQALEVVINPASMKEKPNVMSEWIDRLSAAGASILLIHGKHFDDLQQTADAVLAGVDLFGAIEKRIRYSIDHCLKNPFATDGKVVAMGSSRHAFAILLSMAKNTAITAGVAHQPIIYWPRMREFGGQDNELVHKHDLYNLSGAFPPRPLMIQTGYNEQRIGQEHIEKFNNLLKQQYRLSNSEDHFFHDILTIPGHDHTRIPDDAIDVVVPWLKHQDIL